MRLQRGPSRQLFKLTTLLDFYEANPDQQYCIVAAGHSIQTSISAPEEKQYQSEYYQSKQSVNYPEVDEMAKRTIGLFSNLIKQMKDDTPPPQHRPQSQPQPHTPTHDSPSLPQCRQYEFYYDEFKSHDVSPGRGPSPSGSRGTSTKRVKDRATGLAKAQNDSTLRQDGGQRLIDNQNSNLPDNQNSNLPDNQNSNHLNSPQRLTPQSHERQPHKPDRIFKRKPEQKSYIDLDFSFDEINRQIDQEEKQNKPQGPAPAASNQILIRIIDTVSPEKDQTRRRVFGNHSQKESVQYQATEEPTPTLTFPQSLVPAVVSRELQNSYTEVFCPIPHQTRQEVRLTLYRQHEMTAQIKEAFKVEGAKEVESRVYEQRGRQSDPREIEIDFDLDLNFV